MKNLKIPVYTLLFALILSSCLNDRKETTTDAELDSTITDSAANEAKPLEISSTPWFAELDTVTQAFSLKRNDVVKTEDLDSVNVLKALNKNYPQNPLVWNRHSGDTAYVSIPNASYLTQQSGTLGAKLFLAECTYSITEIPGVKVVNFDFKVGDHASPGAYTRKDFNFSMPE